MQRDYRSRMLAILVAVLMVVSMTACQTSISTSTSTPSASEVTATTAVEQTTAPAATTAVEQTTAPATAAAIDPFTKYDTTVVIHAARKTRAVIKFIDGEDYTNNAFTKFVKDKLNVEVQYDWMVDESQYEQKVNLTIASGAIPDCFDATATQEQMLLESGLILDITDIFDQYASPLLKKIVQGDPNLYKTVTVGGKLYDIPFMPSKDFATNVLEVRKDWLDKVGLAEPKTADEFRAVLDAFVNKDPDGNGKKDTIGLSLSKDFNVPAAGIGDIGPMFAMYNAYIGAWIKDSSGKLAYGSIQPEMKAALQNLQDLYKAGLIDPEFSVKDQSKVNQDIIAEKSGVEFGVFWTPAVAWNDVYAKNQNLKLSNLDIPSVDGKPVKSTVILSPLHKTVISKACKNPEAVIKMVSLAEEMFWGSGDIPTAWHAAEINPIYESIGYDAGMNNYPLVMMEPPTLNYELVKEVTDAVNAKDPNLAVSAEGKSETKNILDYLQNGNKTQWCMWALRVGPNSATGVSNARQDEGALLVSEFYGTPGPVQTERSSTLKKMEQEMITKIIMSEAPVSSFDDFVTSWKGAGGDDLTAEINAWHDKQ